MKGKKKVVYSIMIFALCLSVLTGCTRGTSSNSSKHRENKIKIGISQIVEHKSLDDARKGFIDALAANGYK